MCVHVILPKVQIRRMVAIYENVLKVLPRKPTTLVKDNSKLKNPYLSRYGETWVDKLNDPFFVSKFCCISDIISTK